MARCGAIYIVLPVMWGNTFPGCLLFLFGLGIFVVAVCKGVKVWLEVVDDFESLPLELVR